MCVSRRRRHGYLDSNQDCPRFKASRSPIELYPCGWGGEVRTPGLLDQNQPLFQLSYAPSAAPTGLEPARLLVNSQALYQISFRAEGWAHSDLNRDDPIKSRSRYQLRS